MRRCALFHQSPRHAYLEAQVPWPVQVQSQGGTVMSTDANRREAMRIIVGLAGTTAWAGGPNDADHKKLAEAPVTADDHRALATRYRGIAGEQEKAATTFEDLAALYQKGL